MKEKKDSSEEVVILSHISNWEEDMSGKKYASEDVVILCHNSN
jgi:hypothetical protein